MDFNKLEWHDAVINSINIDRNPAEKDSISFEIEWSNDQKNIVTFSGLRHAELNLNFGAIGKEIISTAEIIEDSEEINTVRSIWLTHGIDPKIKCYVINTVTTGSIIKLFAESFSLE